MKYKLIIGALLFAVLGVGNVGTALAVEANNEGTFGYTEPTPDVAELRFGSNLLLAGNGIMSEKTIEGLLLSTGNELNLKTKSEYGFVAGNIIHYNAETAKDLFVAGNVITISDDAKIGRDTFIAGNNIRVEADLPGDLAVTANKAILNDITIDGDANFDVNELAIEGKVVVTGKIIINSNAAITGLDNIDYKEIEKYEVVELNITAVEVWVAKIFSIAALFIVFAIIMALFPGVNKRVSKELTITQFGKDILIGMITLLFVPIIAVFLLLSFVGIPAALLLVAAYIAMIYVAQGYSGLWIGKVIVEKVAHGKINAFVEMLIGITALGLLVMIPWIGAYIGLLSLLLGLGLFMQSIKPNRKKKNSIVVSRTEEVIEETETVEETKEDTSEEQDSKKSDNKPISSKTAHKADQEDSDVKEED